MTAAERTEPVATGFWPGAMTVGRVVVLAVALVLTGCASSSPPPRTTPLAPRSAAGIQRGQASFYGGKYQGRPTASGETFDKNALTAAHPDLAFGTRVRVTNLENGKSVVVRINDRYQPIKGRIIDLSEAAFQRIAPLARGVIPVTVEPVR